LERLCAWYREQLFEHHLPFWQDYGIDHQDGGFLCEMDVKGYPVATDKLMLYQGRGLWVYASLYKHFGDERHLDVARRTYAFLCRHGRDRDGRWIRAVDRRGVVTRPAGRDGFTDLFIAEGLQAYHEATGDAFAMEMALEATRHAIACFDDSSRPPDAEHVPAAYPGMRTLGQEMVALRVLTQRLAWAADNRLEERASRAVDAVLQRFRNPATGLLDEAVANNYARRSDANTGYVYVGHAVQALWIVMDEALRSGDRPLFTEAAELLRIHIEAGWDEEVGGLVQAVRNTEPAVYNKYFWVQEEALVGTMMIIEHERAEWAAAWFARIRDYVQHAFPSTCAGRKVWKYGGNRDLSVETHPCRREHYHHPRHLILNLLALQRLVDAGSTMSD